MSEDSLAHDYMIDALCNEAAHESKWGDGRWKGMSIKDMSAEYLENVMAYVRKKIELDDSYYWKDKLEELEEEEKRRILESIIDERRKR